MDYCSDPYHLHLPHEVSRNIAQISSCQEVFRILLETTSHFLQDIKDHVKNGNLSNIAKQATHHLLCQAIRQIMSRMEERRPFAYSYSLRNATIRYTELTRVDCLLYEQGQTQQRNKPHDRNGNPDKSKVADRESFIKRALPHGVASRRISGGFLLSNLVRIDLIP